MREDCRRATGQELDQEGFVMSGAIFANKQNWVDTVELVVRYHQRQEVEHHWNKVRVAENSTHVQRKSHLWTCADDQ